MRNKKQQQQSETDWLPQLPILNYIGLNVKQILFFSIQLPKELQTYQSWKKKQQNKTNLNSLKPSPLPPFGTLFL